MNLVNTIKDCRFIYREILQGYSYLEEEGIYVKHFAEADLGHLESIYKQCEKKLTSLGIMSTKDKLALLKKDAYWTEDDESAYVNAKAAVSDAVSFQENLIDPLQREQFQKIVEEKAEQLGKIDEKRREVLYPTIESFCDRKINEHYVRLALFKDKGFKEPYLSEEEFAEVSYTKLSELVMKYNDVIDFFCDKNLKTIAVNGFFLNAFLMCNNDPTKFYGKSVLQLTIYQMNLFGKGKFYKSILEEGKDPPDVLYDNVEQNGLEPIVNWFDGSWAQIKSERDRRSSQARQQNMRGRR